MIIDASVSEITRKSNKHSPNQEPQVLFGTGKKYGVTLLSDYINMFGDIIKIRFSKRRGFSGRIKKDGRRVRWT